MGVREALALAERGFRVFPLAKNGKMPIHKGWTDYATSNPEEVARLFCQSWDKEGRPSYSNYCQGYNVGVLTDSMVVVDVDNKINRRGWDDFIRLDPDLNTLTVETPSGGRHYFYDTNGVSYANTNDDAAIGRGVDTRSYHGYVVGAGSVINGKSYRIIYDPSSGIAAAPKKLIKVLRLPKEKIKPKFEFEHIDDPRCIELAIAEIQKLPGCEAGNQSQGAYNAACLAKDCGISEDKALSLLFDLWNYKNNPELSYDDLSNRVANAYLYSRDIIGNKTTLYQFANVNVSALPKIESPSVSTEGDSIVSDFSVSQQEARYYDPLGTWPLLDNINKRPWLVKGLLMRGQAGILGGAGSSGKTNFILAVALHLAAGAPKVLGYDNIYAGHPIKSLIYTAEDDINELALRVYGACTQYGFDPTKVLPLIAPIASVGNEDTILQIARIGDNGNPVINKESVDKFISKVAQHDYGFIALDPLVNLHLLNENDAAHAQFLGQWFNTLAIKTGAAVLVTHHTMKSSDASVNSLRGSGALIASMRSVLIWSKLSPEDAIAMGLSEQEAARITYIADGKQNSVAKTGDKRFFNMASVSLWNGETVGVPVPYDVKDKKKRIEDRYANMLFDYLNENSITYINLKEAVTFIRDVTGDALLRKMKATEAQKLLIQAVSSSMIVEWDGKNICLKGTGRYSIK